MSRLERGAESERICMYLFTKEVKGNICRAIRDIPPAMPLLARGQGPVD